MPYCSARPVSITAPKGVFLAPATTGLPISLQRF